MTHICIVESIGNAYILAVNQSVIGVVSVIFGGLCPCNILFLQQAITLFQRYGLHGNKKSELMLMRCTRACSIFCSQVVSVYIHFVAIHASAAKSRQKSLKPPIFRVQGHSWSSMLTFLRSLSPVLVMISSMNVPICNHFYAR